MSRSRSAAAAVVAALAAILAPGALLAQAPRESVESQVGGAKLSLEYGCPPWNEQRRRQIDSMLPVGGLWRLGADDRTTLVIADGAIRLGDVVVEAGGYGLNVRRNTEKEWSFVLFDGGESTAADEDNTWETPAAFEEKKDKAPEQLALSFGDEKEKGKTLAVRFGPLALHAPIVPVEVKEAELALGGSKVPARWYSVKSADAPRAGTWARTGTTASFMVGDVDGAFDVDLKLEDKRALVRFSNRGRARVTNRIAQVDARIAALKGAGSKAAAAERIAALEAQKTQLAEDLKDLGAAPAPVEVAVPLTAAGSTDARIGAELVKRAAHLFVIVHAGGAVGEAAVEETQLLPPPEKAEKPEKPEKKDGDKN
jgi:hypothetical protein